jgi:non-heme chloroperoxidase
VGSIKGHYDCIRVFSETDTTEDLKKIDIPVLVVHSEDDQIVPIAAAGPAAAKLLKHATLKVYKDFPHGMPTTHSDVINADLLAFFKAQKTATA